MSGRGRVALVGAGPGDPGLITRRGLELLQQAEVVLHDRLIPQELLREVPPGAQVIDVGKERGGQRYSQEQIHGLLVAAARAGQRVVRLKGGDPFVFGRGSEEREACRAAGVPCEVVPGVSSALAGPAAAGVPVTERGVARSFAVVTATSAEGGGEPDWAALARLDTVVVLMGRAGLFAVTRALLAAGVPAARPVAVVEWATTTRQRQVAGPLAEIATRAGEAGIATPSLLVVGETARHAAGTTPLASSLAGKRIVVTRPATAAGRLLGALAARGAAPIACPLIRIELADPPSWDGDCTGYDWAVFSSLHGVRGFWQALRQRGLDARVLGGVRLAAVGPMTAAALTPFGLVADLVPSAYRAEQLVRELGARFAGPGARVLFPCGTLAREELPAGLAALGARVEPLVVYRTLPEQPDATARRALGAGVDAVLFASPSAVDAFVAAGLPLSGLAAALGETTAAQLRRHGLPVGVVAAEHSDEGLIAALEQAFAEREVAA